MILLNEPIKHKTNEEIYFNRNTIKKNIGYDN